MLDQLRVKIVTCKGKLKAIKYKLDGYFEYDGQKYACEYNGCNWHGCPECFPSDRENTMKGSKSLAQRYRNTLVKEKRLREIGYEVITKWSCTFQTDLIQNKDMRDFVKSLKTKEPINLRDCYFGGRTNALVLHKKFTNGEKGHYVDFTSLYPDILKYQRLPVGHPERILNRFKGITTEACEGDCMYGNCTGEHLKLPYFGIMKATFIPPDDLIHPILPIRCNGKLKFLLCFKCASLENDKGCTCPISERSFTHTYCTPEIEVAINMGYIIEEVHEVPHWPQTEIYDPCLKKDYINSFLKIKQQASDFPENIQTEDEQRKYIERYSDHEGILLDQKLIKKNSGLRSLSKLALNSFYGKFGQRTNMKKTKFVNDVGTLYNLMTDKSKVLSDLHIMNEDIMELEFKHSDEFEQRSLGTNIIIAGFCTSWARLKLWSIMNKLGERVLYHDNDSIIFSVKDTDEYIPPLGNYLGQLTNELTCTEIGCKGCELGHWIEEFVSCGPKNYTYKLNTGEISCKVRGFSLNYRNSQIINFNSMKNALLSWKRNDPVDMITIKTEIRRHKHQNPIVYSRQLKKHYSVVYDKRRVLNNFTTVPYGFKNK